jgi:antitoxin ParD1/3/4
MEEGFWIKVSFYTNSWYFCKKKNIMARNTSILLGDYFENFIQHQVQSGKFSSASEVIRAALRLFEESETQKAWLNAALKEGEKSGFVEDFDKENFLKKLHQKASTDK